MPNYDFEKLDAKEFERLSNALCAVTVTPGTIVFGAGTDGGREAVYEGKMKYPLEKEPWSGYLVVQCKQKEKVTGSARDASWAISQLNAEMEMYKTAKVKRRKPEYFLFITNVELSAKLKTGAKDKFIDRLNHWVKELGMKGAAFWDRDKLGNLLDINPEIAKRFGQLLPGDLIDAATKFFLAQHSDIKTTLSLFLQNELLEDQFVSLKQAGQKTDEAPPLARVFVDLQATGLDRHNRPTSVFAADAVQWASDRCVSPSKMSHYQQLAVEEFATPGQQQYYPDGEMILSPNENQEKVMRWKDPSRFVFIGGPGQGKSTLVQYLAQRHRAALLSSGLFVVRDAKVSSAIPGIAKEANEAGCGLPKHARIPFRIILEKFANDLATGEVASVMDYIVTTVKNRSEQPFTRENAEQILKEMPLLVAFDGLDEVPAVSNRKEVLRAVRRFFTEVQTKDADVLIIATTRPQGYSDEFDRSDYNHLTLSALTKPQALVYAKRLVEAKYPTRVAMQKDVMQRLEAAAGEKAIARLMESPLQVTIMAVLVESVDKLPRERYVLFQKYYDIIYEREQGRGGKLSSILHRYRQRIEVLHDRIGLRLQVEGETAAGTDGKTARQSRLTKHELEEFIRDYLAKDGHEGEELDRMTKEFMTVALDRLVFIMPLQLDSYGFEVRSLQEFAAARELVREPDYSTVRNRLRAIAPIPYWRNTALFAIGRVFAQGDAYCAMIGDLCAELNNDESDRILSRTLAGSRLALDIIEEGIGEERPIYYKGFLDQALLLLQLPYVEVADRLALLYEPTHEQRYTKAILAAVGITANDLHVMPLAILLRILARKVNTDWADLLLRQLWPTDVTNARSILEQLINIMPLDMWQLEMVEKAARESSAVWVANHLSGNVRGKIRWIDSAAKLVRNYSGRATLKSTREAKKPNESVEFQFSSDKFTEQVLDYIAEGKPTHVEWLPFLLGRDFLLQPSATSLADVIEAIANAPTYQHKSEFFHGLPWQLHLALNQTKSKEELLTLAQRARAGKLGDTADWLAAEKRWKKMGCVPSDFQVFSEEEWPFTAAIAKHGIQPFSAISSSNVRKNNDPTGKALLEAFKLSGTARTRIGVASAFLFHRECIYNRKAAFPVPVTTIVDLVQATDWPVEGTSLLTLLEPSLNWADVLDELDSIGASISFMYSRLDHREERLVADAELDAAISKFGTLLTIKPEKEGILRFLAAIISTHAHRLEYIKLPESVGTNLSPQGEVALTAIQVLAKDEYLDTDSLKQRVINFWTVPGPAGRYADMPQVIHSLVSRGRLLTQNVELLGQLLGSEVIDLGIKKKIVGALINQTQHRSSGFGEEDYKKRLQIAA